MAGGPVRQTYAGVDFIPQWEISEFAEDEEILTDLIICSDWWAGGRAGGGAGRVHVSRLVEPASDGKTSIHPPYLWAVFPEIPVPFSPLDLGSGIGFFADPGSPTAQPIFMSS